MKTNRENINATIAQLGKCEQQMRTMGESFKLAAEALGRAAHTFQLAQQESRKQSHTT